MTDPATYATHWFLAPPDGHPWGLTAEDLATDLARRPDAVCTTHRTITGRDRIEFGFLIGDWMFTGAYAPDRESLTLEMCTAPAASEVLTTWFLGLLPPGAEIVFNTQDGVDNGYGNTNYTLPHGGGAMAVARALGDHLRQVWSTGHTTDTS
ncbi:hypothetical protein [Embleya sp. NPDC050493]|uniref:hypothetical protein n=1 Tax=Embleya sp. NPDC050493 TaxID=3363989 RepID=UPI0037B5EF7C